MDSKIVSAFFIRTFSSRKSQRAGQSEVCKSGGARRNSIQHLHFRRAGILTVWFCCLSATSFGGNKQTPAITSPVPGSILSGPSETFTWTAGAGVSQYQLWLGTTGPGSEDVGAYTVGSTSVSVSGIPTSGAALYVELRWLSHKAWQAADYTYTEASSASPALTLGASSVSFGNVNLNTTATQSVSLSSSGTAALTISAGSVTGAGFSISGLNFPVTLNPGQAATLYIGFDPTVTGTATGAVTLTSNAANGSTATISLSGTGQTVSHQVSLTWNAPTSSTDPVAGYNVYRAASGSSSYQLLNTSVDANTSYDDNTVQSGMSYSYYVESVDSSGNQSSPSNTYTASIP